MAQLMVAHWLGRWLQKGRQDLVNIVREDSAAIGYSWRLHMHHLGRLFLAYRPVSPAEGNVVGEQ